MTVYGDGKQTRSFQYVSDLVISLNSNKLSMIQNYTQLLVFSGGWIDEINGR